jgi:ribonuclease-3 family protein
MEEAKRTPGTDWGQQPVRALAYMGDAVYEMHVRERTLREGGNVEALHKATVAYVSAAGQALLSAHLLPHMTHEELAIFKRARNHKTNTPRRVAPHSYQLSTAFEAVLGYLYLKPDRSRLQALLALADAYHKEKTDAP